MKSCKHCVYNPDNSKVPLIYQVRLSGMCTNCQRSKRLTDNFKRIFRTKEMQKI